MASTQSKITGEYKNLIRQQGLSLDNVDWNDFIKRIRCWHVNLIGAIVGRNHYVSESEADEFWMTLVLAFAGGNENNISTQLPYVERYNQPHYLTEGLTNNKGAKLLVADLFEAVQDDNISSTLREEIESIFNTADLYLYIRTAELFNDFSTSNELKRRYLG